MSISGQNLSVVIVTLKSEKVIHNCIKSINQNLPIIVVENSNNQEFKENLENKYNNLKCILSKSNLGMGAGNNIGIKASNTEYVLILNPDVILEKNTIEEIFFATKSLSNFTILAPLEKKFANYGSFNKKKLSKDVDESPFEVPWLKVRPAKKQKNPNELSLVLTAEGSSLFFEIMDFQALRDFRGLVPEIIYRFGLRTPSCS